MYKKILVPLDGSKLAEVVLPHVEQLAWELGSTLILLRVIKPPRHPGSPGPEYTVSLDQDQERAAHREAETYLSGHRGELRNKRVEASTHVVVREAAAAAILDFADQKQVDLIAMSTHGRSGLGRLVYGSVAEKVLQGATCPVLLIRARLEA